jgi:hypothetical protein
MTNTRRIDLRALLDSPAQEAAFLSPREAEQLLGQLISAMPHLMQRARDDHLIDLETAGRILDRSSRWIRDHADELPFLVKIGDDWKCSSHAVQQFIADRRQK